MKIKIVPPQVQFAERLHNWRNQPSTLKYNPVRNSTIAELREMLRTLPVSLTTLDTDTVHRWFVDNDGEIVGSVSLSDVNLMMGTAEIGYMIGESHHRRGIATEAVKLWTAMIFDLTAIRKLTASVAEENVASLRVLEKLGYKREGLLREHYLIQDKPTNEIIFGLLRREWSGTS